MNFGITLRNCGPESTAELMIACARTAEREGIESLWLADHIAIPPDDAEGSGGRYLDPLTTLAFLAAATTRIRLGTGVLNLPYRAPLPTAKAIATVQELSGGRLELGVGVGWMQAEFRALGVPRSRRGELTDEALRFIRSCFAADEVEAHGQPFLFLPRPICPPILIGGAAPHALERAVTFGDGWLPMAGDPERLEEPIQRLQELAATANRPSLEVKVMTALPIGEAGRMIDWVHRMSEVGVTSLIHGARYTSAAEFEEVAGCVASCMNTV